MQSHYLVLGVPRKATQDVIKKAYRELAKKYHPDRNPEKTSNLFQKVQEAYDTLSDDRKRRDYDNSLGGGSSGSSSRSDEDGFRGNKPTMEGGWMDPTAPRNRNPNVELAKKLKQKQDYYARHKSGRYVHEGQFSGGGAGRGDEAAVLHGGAEADSSPVVFWTRYSAWLRQFLLVVPFFVVPVGLLGFVFCTCVDHSMTGFAKKKSQKGKILYDNEGKAYCRDTHGVYRKLSSALDISD